MSAEAAQSFLKMVNQDAALKAQNKGMKGDENKVLTDMVKVGASKKLAFTTDELKAAAKSCPGRMSDQELEKVAGGKCKVILITVGCCTG
jgi:hypothetical protein